MLTRYGGAPTRALLLVTVLLTAVGAVLLGLGLTGPPETPEDALEAVAPGSAVQVGDDGFSLWSRDAGAFETALCTADGTPLLRPVEAYSITVAGTDYHEVARSPRALRAGSYTITCEPEQALYLGPHAERTAPSVVRGPVGVLAGGVLLVLGLVVGVVALVAHRRQKRLEAWRVPPHRLDPSLRRVEDEVPTGDVTAAERSGADDAPGRAELRARGASRRRAQR